MDDLVKRAKMAIDDMQGRVDASKLAMFSQAIDHFEARIAKADALAEAHGKLWSALAEIIEAPGMSPNATVRRMAARAEKALVEDSIAEVKPMPRFYREGSDT